MAAAEKIAIIIQARDENKVNQLLKDLEMLFIPEGFLIDIIMESGEVSRATAYNDAMRASIDAKYKIYIDEAVRITNKHLLLIIVDAFQNNPKLAAIGSAGATVLPLTGDALAADKRAGVAIDTITKNAISWSRGKPGGINEVMAVDGAFIATAIDVSWRTDLTFNDNIIVSAQCLELKKKGYKIGVFGEDVVPLAAYPHESKLATIEEQRQFLATYAKDFFPLVLIVIPTFNRPDYLEISLKSALDQIYPHLEIVISDDSTDDRTENFIVPYLKDERIKYYRHKGFTAADNWAWLRKYVKESSAQYINWLMDDDVFLPKKIAKMLDVYLQNDNIALVTSYRPRIDEKGNLLPDTFNKPLVKETAIIPGQLAGKNILVRMANIVGEPTTALIKKSYMKNGDFGWTDKEGKYAVEDFNTWLHILEKGDLFYFVEPLSYFRWHEGNHQKMLSVTIGQSMCWIIDIQYAYEKKIFLQTPEDYGEALRKIANHSFWVLKDCMEKNMYNSEIEDLWKKLEEMIGDLRKIASKLSYINEILTKEKKVKIIHELKKLANDGKICREISAKNYKNLNRLKDIAGLSLDILCQTSGKKTYNHGIDEFWQSTALAIHRLRELARVANNGNTPLDREEWIRLRADE